ncbi:MAG: alpha-L-fucosidase [bacterium]
MADTKWFSDARYGMIVHYGLYSLLGRHEWVMNREQIPPVEYRKLARRFTARMFDAEELCDLAVNAGMRYITLTTMHHDGFRLYDSELTDFTTARTAAKRDLVSEVVAAARKRGLRISLYHSLNNWMDQPDAVAALEDPAAYELFMRNTFARIRELVLKFNPIDVLWYDGWWPFNAEKWRGEVMNDMVRAIQPHILFNGRNGLSGDFATPEGHLGAPRPYRPWEACLTLNNSWGFCKADKEWKTPQQLVDMLATVAQGRGNLLMNVGPCGDGSIPKAAVTILTTVGDWLRRCGECIYDTDSFTFDLRERGDHRGDWCSHGPMTAKGRNLYLLVRRWAGSTIVLGGLKARVQRVNLLGDGREVAFSQDDNRVVLSGLPAAAPDPVCPVLRFECDRAPVVYLTGGMREPAVPHPHYDPCPSDIVH